MAEKQEIRKIPRIGPKGTYRHKRADIVGTKSSRSVR